MINTLSLSRSKISSRLEDDKFSLLEDVKSVNIGNQNSGDTEYWPGT